LLHGKCFREKEGDKDVVDLDGCVDLVDGEDGGELLTELLVDGSLLRVLTKLYTTYSSSRQSKRN
jgi:hypothetical protein